jgi:hypothetical protein
MIDFFFGGAVWTNPLPFWDIPSRDQQLLEQLQATELVIFKVNCSPCYSSPLFFRRLNGFMFPTQSGRFKLSKINGRCYVGSRDQRRRSGGAIERAVQSSFPQVMLPSNLLYF